MDFSLHRYVVIWLTACLLALVLYLKNKPDFDQAYVGYRAFLLQPWKLVTFVISGSAFVFLAPYTGDPTWNWFDGLFMSILTYMSAPWAVGALYRLPKGKTATSQAYVAIVCWMFSASWSYDGYLLWRDSAYPITWWTNLQVSSVLYLCAGLFWNLEQHPAHGVRFSFMADEWLNPQSKRISWGLFGYGLPFMLLAGGMVYMIMQ